MSVANLSHTFTDASGSAYANYTVIVKMDSGPARIYSQSGSLVDRYGRTITNASGDVSVYVNPDSDYRLELRHPITNTLIEVAAVKLGIVKESGGGSSATTASTPQVTITGNTTLTKSVHGNRLLIVNSASPVTLTIANDTAGAWANDDSITAYQAGVGVITLAAGSGMILRVSLSLDPTSEQFGFVSAVRVGTNEFARMS